MYIIDKRNFKKIYHLIDGKNLTLDNALQMYSDDIIYGDGIHDTLFVFGGKEYCYDDLMYVDSITPEMYSELAQKNGKKMKKYIIAPEGILSHRLYFADTEAETLEEAMTRAERLLTRWNTSVTILEMTSDKNCLPEDVYTEGSREYTSIKANSHNGWYDILPRKYILYKCEGKTEMYYSHADKA